MKNYHAVAIAALAVAIAALASYNVGAAPIKAAAPEHVVPAQKCPVATEYNTGWVVEDTNNDGTADHAYRVYNSGPCKLQAVDTTNTADLIVEFRP